MNTLREQAIELYEAAQENPTATAYEDYLNLVSLINSIPPEITTKAYFDITQPENGFLNVEQMVADYQAAMNVLNDSSSDIQLRQNASDTLQNILSVLNSTDASIVADLEVEGISKEEIEAQLQNSGTPTVSAKVVTQTETDDSKIDNYTNTVESANPTVHVGANLSPAIAAVAAWNPGYKLISIIPVLTNNTSKGTVHGYGTYGAGQAEANGTAHAPGTAFLTGTAHAMAARALHLDYMRARHPAVYNSFAGGNWGLPYDQTALVGELAPEMLVRNGRWQLIGQNGAGFMGLKRGDIIFNHLQTRQLLENGWVTGRGRPVGFNSHVMGTISQNALADGTAALASSAYGDTPITSTVRQIKEASEDFCDAMDYISIALDRMTEAIDHNKSLADLYSTYRDQNPELDAAIAQSGEKLKFSQRAYDRYMAQADASGLDAQYKKQIQNGQLDISNITDERLKAQIDDYQKWYEKAQDVRKEIIDIGQELRDLNLQKLENITDDFDQIISYKKSIIEIYEVINDLNELKGISISEDSLVKMMGEQTDISGYYAGKVDELTKQFNELVNSGVIVKNTDAWWEWTEKINEATAAMIQSNKSVLELKQNILDIRMEPFENAIENIKDLNDEIKSLSGLINDKALFDDATGSLTNAGTTKLGLYGQQLANSKQKAAEYASAINALKHNLANGNMTQEQYNEKLKEYSQAQRQAAADTKTAMDAIIKLAQDGIQKEVDAYSKLIEQKKADLKAEKSYQDYKKQLDDKQSAINAKKAERDAMLNDETKKQQVRKLNNEIAKMQSDLDELVADHEYETKIQAYDDAQDLAKENAETAIDALDTNLELQQEAISGMLKLAQDNYENVYNYLGIIADTYGTTLSEDLSSPWETAKGAVANYMAAVGQANAQVNIDTSKIKVPEAVKKPTPQANEKGDSSIIHGIVNADKGKTPAPDNSQTNNNIWAGIPQTPSTKGASWLNPNGSIYDRMYWNGYTGGYNNQSILYNNLGGPAVHGGYSGTAAQNIWMVEQLKARGFRNGGIAHLIKNSGEDGLAFVRNNEGLISPEHVPLIQSLLYNLNGADGLVTDMKNILSATSMGNSNAVHINIDTLFNNEGSVTKDALPGLEKILNMAVDRMEHKITQACKSPRYGGVRR